MPPSQSHAVRAGGREKRHGELQGERVHLRAVAGGWQVRKCHFRGLKHLRAVKIFPLARVPNGELGEARSRRGAARPDIATSRHARTGDREGEREPLRPAAERGSAPACNGR
jgi:hypothetical protein